jgi:hypothetical protein
MSSKNTGFIHVIYIISGRHEDSATEGHLSQAHHGRYGLKYMLCIQSLSSTNTGVIHIIHTISRRREDPATSKGPHARLFAADYSISGWEIIGYGDQ